MEWTKKDQSIFECFSVALAGLKREGWITLEESETIRKIISKGIERGITRQRLRG